ncbi:MAG: hypothetical protein AAGI63_12905 [Planctomycetota bacterium]
MRTSAFAVAIVAASTLISAVQADDDFSALLADLTFTDAPAAAKPSSVAAQEVKSDLKPIPRIELPAAKPDLVADLDGFEMIESDQLATLAPEVSLQSPIPAKAAPQVDLDAAFALQDPAPLATSTPAPFVAASESAPAPLFNAPQAVPAPVPAARVPSQVVGHQMHPMASNCQGGCSGGCEPMHATSAPIMCRPRTPVNLPSSTLLQYFRSDVCHTNVWNGYHRKCCDKSHLDGSIFAPKSCAPCGEVIDCAPCASSNCASCDGSCD